MALIPVAWVRTIGLKPRLLRVAVSIAAHYNPRYPEQCRPSLSTLAKVSGVARRHVQEVVNELEELGIITIKRGARGAAHTYRIERYTVHQNGEHSADEPIPEAYTVLDNDRTPDQTPTVHRIGVTNNKNIKEHEIPTGSASADPGADQQALIDVPKVEKKARRGGAAFTAEHYRIMALMIDSYKARFDGSAIDEVYRKKQLACAARLLKSHSEAEIARAIQRAENHEWFGRGDRFTSLAVLIDHWAKINAVQNPQAPLMRTIEGGRTEATPAQSFNRETLRAARAATA